MLSASPLRSVRVVNYQSIEDSTIELGRLTVLVGPGDAGKSAILRALRAAFLNEGDDRDIRHGAKQCSVELLFEDGMSVTWWKERGKGGSYRLIRSSGSTIEFTKTGGAVPDEIAFYFGIMRIEVDSTTELTPQLSDQHDQPFILWETGSKRARILGKATRLDTVVTAQMKCKNAGDQLKRQADAFQKQVEAATEQLEALPNYEAMETELARLNGDIQVIQQNLDNFKSARQKHARYQELYGPAMMGSQYELIHEHVTTVLQHVTRAITARSLFDRLTAVRARKPVDVKPVLQLIPEAVAAVGMATTVRQLQREWQTIHDTVGALEDDISELATHLGNKQAEYQDACTAAGVCEQCGGLIDHTACTKELVSA